MRCFVLFLPTAPAAVVQRAWARISIRSPTDSRERLGVEIIMLIEFHRVCDYEWKIAKDAIKKSPATCAQDGQSGHGAGRSGRELTPRWEAIRILSRHAGIVRWHAVRNPGRRF